ncbi:hypothetical protein FWF74_04070 [Candidatus Saccharibacteria bacterium]|nr:hypothetical protein [Candidatus Saccharibacteria bacterium]MCL1962767.1 hypothetical protein [Candidatus Saccharibacteria bacterium]
MDAIDYWRKQESDKALFPDILWSKPERRDAAGQLAIVGGNVHSFAGVAAAYKTALAVGAGSVRVILPDVLKKKMNTVILSEQRESKNLFGSKDSSTMLGMTDVIFAPSNPSGGLARDALAELNAAAEWADAVLFIGDSGQNSETAALLEIFLNQNKGRPIIVTRDAIDLIKNVGESLFNRAPTHLIVSLGQLQKLFQSVYYPRVITFSQGVRQIVETLHKFTITYPVTITLFHNENLFAAYDGQVITQPFHQPLRVWSGEIATRAAVWQMWNPAKPTESIATSWTEL